MRGDTPAEVLSGAAGWRPVVSSWMGATNLAATVPIISGRVTATVSQEVPERLTLTVPRWDGRDWLPGTDVMHPLARFGQELSVSVVVSSAVSDTEWETRIGRYLVTGWDYDDTSGEVRVSAAGLLQRVATDRLPSPMSPRPGGTLVSEFRRLLPIVMSAGFDPALVDRACPRSMEWAEDRLAALYEIADAWPARLRTDPWGQLLLLPPLSDIPAPVVSLTDGERGTVVSAPRSDTQDGAPNRIVVQSSASGRESVRVVVDQTTGPTRVGRGSHYPTVVEQWSSPLLRTVEQARAAGRTRLARRILPSRTVPVTCVPDPRLDLDDPVEVVREDVRHWGWVTGYDLPLTVADGAMRLDVGLSV